MEFKQAPVEKDLYIKIPKVFELNTKGDTIDHLLKIHKNVYGQKQSGRVRYQHLAGNIIKEIGFTRSIVDELILYRGRKMYALYTDASILAGNYQEEIFQIIEELNRAKFILTSEGDLQDFLGINTERQSD